MSIKLITAKIENFKSLGDIELNFRDLTIIVGANYRSARDDSQLLQKL